MAGSCEHGNEHSSSIKGEGGFLDWLSDCQQGLCSMEFVC
jgi:hypothetical protein